MDSDQAFRALSGANLYDGWRRSDKNLKVYGFDLNDTLITTPSGKYPPVSVDDWKWRPHVRTLLIDLLGNHSRNVVWILTNQGWNDSVALARTKTIAENIREDLLRGYAAEYSTGCDHRAWLTVAAGRHAATRKPSPVSWTDIVSAGRLIYETVMVLKVYCGDDADRTAADVFFARNTHTKFLHADALNGETPIVELVENAEPATEHPRVIAAVAALNDDQDKPPNTMTARVAVKEIRRRLKKLGQSTVIMICGLQGSGKSTFAGYFAQVLSDGGKRVADVRHNYVAEDEPPTVTVCDEFSTNIARVLQERGLPAIIDRVHADTSARTKSIAGIRSKVPETVHVINVHVWANPAVRARNVWERGVINNRPLPAVATRTAEKKWNTSDLEDLIVVEGGTNGERRLWIGPTIKDLRL